MCLYYRFGKIKKSQQNRTFRTIEPECIHVFYTFATMFFFRSFELCSTKTNLEKKHVKNDLVYFQLEQNTPKIYKETQTIVHVVPKCILFFFFVSFIDCIDSIDWHVDIWTLPFFARLKFIGTHKICDSDNRLRRNVANLHNKMLICFRTIVEENIISLVVHSLVNSRYIARFSNPSANLTGLS